MELYCYLPVFGQSGWETVCRSILVELDKLGVRIQLDNKNEWNTESCFFPADDYDRLYRMTRTKVSDVSIQLTQQYPSSEYLNSELFKRMKKSFCFSIFETTRCPAPWVYQLNKVTKTLTFSEFNKKTYTDSGVTNVEVTPIGIDCSLFHPGVRPFREKRPNEFVFLTSGDFTERKNFEGLIEAYVKEFNKDDNVVLIIKAHYSGFIKRYKDECIRRFREIVNRFNPIDPPKILFFGEKVPWYSVPHFYTAGDCFVLVSRGEGIGLPYMEALASGIPCITSAFGGQLQFLNDSNSLIVNTDVRVIDDMEYIRKCLNALNHSWAFPEVNDIRAKLRFAYEFRDIMKEKGKSGRADMEKRTWKKTSLDVLRRCFDELPKMQA